MITRAPMDNICRTSDSGSGRMEATAFIQCIYFQEPQIYELWCLGLDRISHKVHPTDHVEVTTVTVKEFVTGYLAENERQIEIIEQLSVNESVKFWYCPTNPGEMYCRLLQTYLLALNPQVGGVPTITIRTGEGGSKMLTES